LSTTGWVITLLVVGSLGVLTEPYWGDYAQKVPLVGAPVDNFFSMLNTKVMSLVPKQGY